MVYSSAASVPLGRRHTHHMNRRQAWNFMKAIRCAYTQKPGCGLPPQTPADEDAAIDVRSRRLPGMICSPKR